ncbi:MAG: methylmalonyl-CoA mutase [Dehalococcoidia bacterium]|nr:methylmalonyl-CoA mutase [Dehalococcoidia bacterium]
MTTRDEWAEKVYGPAVRKAGEREALFATSSGTPVQPVYDPSDLGGDGTVHGDAPLQDGGGWDYLERLGFPGEYPFTRGVQPTMYRGRLWTMRQYAGFGDAEESNRRYRYLLDNGQTGLSVAFDLPTQIGYDADDPMASGEVGKVGVSICSIEDMNRLFDGIPLSDVTTSMTINATASILLALYCAVAKRQGVALDQIGGTVQNDILKEYIARGTYIFPPQASMRLITDLFAFCRDSVPQWNTISISGYHIREAGATAPQEIAFTLANAVAYVEAALKAGLSVDDFAPRLSFFFGCHNNLIEEVAKFRAARRMWARIMRDRFKAQDPRSMMLRFHTQTAGVTLTAQQADNNIVRTAIQALAAVIGGTQSLHTNSRDEALSLPTQKSVEIALRTQQIIGYESGVADTVDPFAGSYYVESLTDQVEEEASRYIDQIDALGGSLEAIERGFQQKEIQDASYGYVMQVEEKKRIIVGVNEFQSEEPEVQDIMRVDPTVGQKQSERLAELRSRRDGAAVERMRARLADVALSNENTMPVLIEAVENQMTMGEICRTLREAWGEQREFVIF